MIGVIMISTSDYSYIETKLVKRGKMAIPQIFQKLIERIKNKYGVTPINICYEVVNTGRPRLEVVFEEDEERILFTDKTNIMYDKALQKEVLDLFLEIYENSDFLIKQKYKIDNLFVTFSSFKHVALAEVNNISENEQIQIEQHYAEHGLWRIMKNFQYTIFFFFTDNELALNNINGVCESIRKDFYKLIKPRDEFNYLNFDDFKVFFDTKENFDTKYGGSWRRYFD